MVGAPLGLCLQGYCLSSADCGGEVGQNTPQCQHMVVGRLRLHLCVKQPSVRSSLAQTWPKMEPFSAILEPKIAVGNPPKASTKWSHVSCYTSKVQIGVAALHLKNVSRTLGNEFGVFPHGFPTKISGFWHTPNIDPKRPQMAQK